MKEFEFIEIKIKETKKEVKDNEKWLKALVNEYCKRNNDETLRAIDIARIMIKHYRNILTEQQEMLKEIKKAYKNI